MPLISDSTILSNTNSLIRNSALVTRANHSMINDQLTNNKISRGEGTSALGTNTYTATVSWLPDYLSNFWVAINFVNANTGLSSLNINGFGVGNILKNNGSGALVGLTGGELFGMCWLYYNGSNFQLQNGSGGSGNINIAGNSTPLGGSVTQDQITGLSGIGLIKRTGANTLANAVASTDYAPATTGTPSQILANNGSGGFANITVGSGLTLSGGILTASVVGGLPVNNPAYTGILSTGTLGFADTNVLASFQSSVNSYNQLVLQNTTNGTTASSDFVVTNNLSTATTYYGDFGINSGGFSGTGSLNAPSNVFLTSTSSDLAIGTTTNNGIHFVTNNSAADAMTIFANGNISIASNAFVNNLTRSYLSSSTSGGTTTLTVSSAYYQNFTGTSPQTVTMPVTSTLSLGFSFFIANNSSGVLTVNSSGGNIITAMQPGSCMNLNCTSLSATDATAWNSYYSPPNPMIATGDIIYGGVVSNGVANPARLATGAAGYALISNGAGTAPSWQAVGALSGLTTNGILYATSATSATSTSAFSYNGSSTVSIGISGIWTTYFAGTNMAIIANNGTGEFRIGGILNTYFTTLYSSGVEVMRLSSGKKILIGTSVDNNFSYLQNSKSIALGYNTQAVNYSLGANDFLVNMSASSTTATLPTAASISGHCYIIKNTSTGTVTIATTSSQTIDGASPGTLAANGILRVMSNGSNWISW